MTRIGGIEVSVCGILEIIRSAQVDRALGEICFGASTDLMIAKFFIVVPPGGQDGFVKEPGTADWNFAVPTLQNRKLRPVL
jgi:hypothetical protein